MHSDQDAALRDHEVRLFPAVHISSAREAELRATAAFLAMVKAVSEFGRAIVRLAGGPAGHITCYTEVPCRVQRPDGVQEFRPDGLIHVTRGKTEWQALVEVKVGNNPLDQEQFDAYHEIARQSEYDAVITVSNQPAKTNGLPPISVDGRHLKKVPAKHFSWERLLSEARVFSTHQEIADTDQSWMLNEWIRYVANSNSKIIESPDLGEYWSAVLKAARKGTLAAVSVGLEDVAQKWNGFLSMAALRLRAQLGVDVQPRMSRKDKANPQLRLKKMHTTALKSSTLSGILKVPDAISDVCMDVNLAAKTVRYSITVDAPIEGRATTRVNWLVKQLLKLPQVPEDLSVTVEWDQKGVISHADFGDVRHDPACLYSYGHDIPIPKTCFPKKFLLDWTNSLRKGKGRSNAPVLDGIFDDLERFYRLVVQGLRPYVPPAPRLPVSDGDNLHSDEDAPKGGVATQTVSETQSVERVAEVANMDIGTDKGPTTA